MEHKVESKFSGNTEIMDLSGFSSEGHIAYAKELRAEAISGFMRIIGQRIKHKLSQRKAAKHEQDAICEDVVSSNVRPCF